MVILHVLVTAVLVFVGKSTACVEWTIVSPPIIFGKTAELSCVTVTPNASYNTQKYGRSWLGGIDHPVLTINNGTNDHNKYAEIGKWHHRKFESILQIHKFNEQDVNVDYWCSIGGHENRKRLSLTPDKFEYHPDKDTTTVLASFRNGHLDVIVKILKVYPVPKCTIMFDGKIISRRLITKTTVNGIFYKVLERVAHQVDVCRGQLTVTCIVGKTKIPIHQEAFNGCTKTKEESPKHSDHLITSIILGALLFVILIIGIIGLAKYGKLKNVLCCSVSLRGEETILVTDVAKLVSQFIQKGRQECTTNDAGQEESHEMIPPPKQ